MTNQVISLHVDKQIVELTKRIEQLELENSELKKKHIHNASHAEIRVIADIVDPLQNCELEYLFESILINIRDAAFVLDAESSRVVLFNERACEIYGYSESEFPKLKFFEFSSVLGERGEWSSFVADLQKKRMLVIEGSECQRNGNILPVEISISYVGEKGLDYIIAFVRDISDARRIRELESHIKQGLEDKVEEQTAGLRKINNLLRHEITERRKSEQALSDKEQQLQTIINIIPNLIAYIDKNRCFQFNNKEYEKCFNQTVNDLQGKPVEQVIGEKRYNLIKNYITTALQGNEVVFEEQIMCETGDKRWMRGHYYPDFDKHGQVSGFISLVSDITKEKERQHAEKTRLVEHFHQARLGTIGEMATEIAHELNQPLCAIVNFSEAGLRMLELNSGSSQDISEALAEISVQGNRAGKIIERLRSFARRREPKYEQLDANAVIGETIHIAKLAASWDSIDLIFEANKHHPVINADNLLIQQVILNLIRNARDAISCLQIPIGKVTISTEIVSAEYVKIMVSDTAGLLSGDDREKIFQPFYSTKNDGLGMGLAISNTIVELHGGKMQAISTRDNETVIQFTLPTIRRAHSYNVS